MSNSKLRQYKIKLTGLHGVEVEKNPSFSSKRAFLQSDLCDKIKVGGISGTAEVHYGRGYSNFFDFGDYKSLRRSLDMCTEPELLDEFIE